MAAPLDYVYDTEQVEDLISRTLTVFENVDDHQKIPEDLRVPAFNAIVNMVATVRQSNVLPSGLAQFAREIR